MKVKYLKKKEAEQAGLFDYDPRDFTKGFPNFHKSGCIPAMKKIYENSWQYHQNGKEVLLVQSGSHIYHVPKSIYNLAN